MQLPDLRRIAAAPAPGGAMSAETEARLSRAVTQADKKAPPHTEL